MTLEDCFPGLRISGYTKTSDIDDNYNCIAWAARDSEKWWEPHPDYYWPAGAIRAYTLDAYIDAFQSEGYCLCTDKGRELNFEKVALYVDLNGQPSHMARQLPSGSWTSKLGHGPDIEHPNFACLEGDKYGQVAVILRRPIPQTVALVFPTHTT